MPSVLVRPGASDGQLLDGLSLLAPDIRQRLLTILHAMEHRQVGQAHVVLASPRGPRLTFRHNRALAGTRPRTQPQNVGPSQKPKTFAPLRAAFPAVTVSVAVL